MAVDSPNPPDFVHRFEGGDPGLPTLLLLHGTGGDENDLLEVGRYLLPGAALLSPRGKVLENGLTRFFRRLAEGVFDLEDLRCRTGDANIAAALLLLRPGTLREAVLFHAMVPLVPEKLPELKGRRVFLSAGQADRLIPPRESERLAALLEEAGAEVRLFWQPGGHGLERAEIEAAREWTSLSIRRCWACAW